MFQLYSNQLSKILPSVFLFLFLFQCKETIQNNEEILSLLLLSNGNGSSSVGPCPPGELPSGISIANTVVSANSTVSGFSNPAKAINGICGGGENSGSLDVYALNLTGAGANLVLSWGGKTVKNVTGIDFVIYENPFKVSETNDRYAFDPMLVYVSLDGTNYCGFDVSGFDGTVATNNKITSWPGFAGLRPVIYHMATKKFTLTELFTEIGSEFLLGGGDGFDLDNLITGSPGSNCDATARTDIISNGFKFIKMISASAVNNPATGAGYVYPHEYNNGPDIDGVVGRLVE